MLFCSAIEKRLLIRDKDTRELLLQYARATSKQPLSESDAKSLWKERLTDEHWVRLLNWIKEDLGEQFTRFSPPPLSRLLTAIAQPSPVSGFILRPADTAPVLRRVVGDDTLARTYPDVLHTLQNNCPALFELLGSELCKPAGEEELRTFPLGMFGLLRWLADACENLVQCESPQLSNLPASMILLPSPAP